MHTKQEALSLPHRPEVRNSALEVLFDTLKRHGSSFAASFWRRVFDSVLLPIFDHVRAEVRTCVCACVHVCVCVGGWVWVGGYGGG